eukprot:TRINITY_DN74557_c0_g1_i1.p1 TRINITY_DN74557_c0_g1~~TRINITY_DN74557_c0_g1_i1.p1  ORF type:complete len:134 (-),score=7.95 TRINITY_DN74557_c0_g1_i1:19-420(-)
MPRIPATWPLACQCGCDGIWNFTRYVDRPPFLKSPYDCPNRSFLAYFLPASTAQPSDEWLDLYQASLERFPRPIYSAVLDWSPIHWNFFKHGLPTIVGVALAVTLLRMYWMYTVDLEVAKETVERTRTPTFRQ